MAPNKPNIRHHHPLAASGAAVALSLVEVEVPRGSLLEPKPLLLWGLPQEVGRFLQHILDSLPIGLGSSLPAAVAVARYLPFERVLGMSIVQRRHRLLLSIERLALGKAPRR